MASLLAMPCAFAEAYQIWGILLLSLIILWLFLKLCLSIDPIAQLTSVAKYARKPLRRCARAVLWALAHAVGATAVAVFYPPAAMAKAIKATETKESVWMFRILFGAGLILAAIGAVATLRCITRNGF